MPTYAYACTECGHAFDIHQSFSDAALTECPSCGGRLRKVFSSVGVVFKGSGFYRTDSRSSSTSTTSSTPSSTSPSSSTTAAKPAAASATASSSSSSSSPAGSAAKPAAG